MITVRVFPRATNLTPDDPYAFIGYPPLFLPQADEVHISVAFTWDIPKAKLLAQAWSQYYSHVSLGGVALGSYSDGFIPGLYIKRGVTFTSRGCNNNCDYCLVPKREGKLREIPIQAGNIINDNNLLQCGRPHIRNVMDMLRHEHTIKFSGGLDASLLTDEVVEDLRALRIKALFLACDRKHDIRRLEKAKDKLRAFRRDQLRCYVMIGYNQETISEALERLIAVWDLGFIPFAQLYQPPDKYIEYPSDWRKLASTWARPARIKAMMRQRIRRGTIPDNLT